MHDVSMVIGAIRAGKLTSDDPRIPDSVKKIITDMKAQGIDPKSADQKAIRGYLRANPNALRRQRSEIKRTPTQTPVAPPEQSNR